MARAPKPLPLSTTQARQIWLRAQRLDRREPFGEGAQAVTEAVAHLGYVQIDTINVIERCHHHILFSRIPSYRRADLRQAQSVDKSVFEYWTHALSYVPSNDFRFFLPAMREHKREGHKWYASVTATDTRKVMRLLRAGELTIRDIEDDVLIEKEHLWQSRKPSKRALQLAFYTGVATISARQGMLKTYDLMVRHFGWDKLPKPASPKEITAYLLDRALRSQGVVSLDSICHLDAPSKKAVGALVAARVRRGELVPVVIEGAGKQEHWAAPAALEPAEVSSDLVHILSPFDPLIIQRKRTNLFFGYNHLFEAYVPKAKRKLGYFALPVLVGDEIVAALDLKTDRQAKKVLMQKWTWVGQGKKTAGRKELKQKIEEELDRFERFQLEE
ncbi:winged helix-turn-helix domain-containing protein [Bradyrhizobium guangzhouense]|uniref:Cytoplasmic protein n=1 Tax=Bradyrhizobium guangzhouense TaxID=1325095 RepID=A0AAE6CAC5_9BRAD|nr:crosslink repair DNA glycosylase YcaQ family protein [Bradyrhizobium guangzhouense]QAU48641.1 cytoplasmic protein [Bradyrhizobium guangzhouense]RXH09603.1 winged helix-turn-helix domain-containing protein [Bradyrhizobium guangzhouense]